METKLKQIGEPLRKEQKLTQKELAEKLRVSKTTYRKWVHRYPTEKGGKPNRENLQEIAQILDLPRDYFLEDLNLNI